MYTFRFKSLCHEKEIDPNFAIVCTNVLLARGGSLNVSAAVAKVARKKWNQTVVVSPPHISVSRSSVDIDCATPLDSLQQGVYFFFFIFLHRTSSVEPVWRVFRVQQERKVAVVSDTVVP